MLYDEPRTDDAYVRANTIGIAPHVAGPIVELPIVDNQRVSAGDLLFVVDPRPYQAILDQARAQLDAHQPRDPRLPAGGRRRRRDAGRRARPRRRTPTTTSTASSRCSPSQFVTRDQVEDARSKSRAARAAVEGARAELGRQQDLLGQLGDVNARRQAAQAAVDDAELNVDYC